MRARTLAQLRDGVAERADITVAASGVRHTHALVDARINRAIQRWDLMCAVAGDDRLLKVHATTTDPDAVADADNWEPRQIVPLPSDFLLMRGVDVLDGDEAVELMPVEELERNETQRASSYLYADTAGFPVGYRLGGRRSSDGAAYLQLFPRADAAYAVRLRYIPITPDLTDPSDLWITFGAGEEWVINDAAAQCLRSDGLTASAEVAAMVAENKRFETEMRFLAATQGGGAARRKLDTRGRRRALLSRLRGYQ